MAIELSTPSFRPREYEGEKIEYLVYGLDDEGNEIECIDGPVDSPDSAAELAGDILEQFPGLYFHVTAVLNDKNGKMKDSEVVWSNFPEKEANGTDETIEYKKGHKNSRGEDAPWVIRDHKNGKVLVSFSKKDDAEAHEPGTKWSSEIRVAFNDENDPNDKWVKDYEGQSVWNFFDDLSDVLPAREALKCIPERYKDAFRDYCIYYGMECPDESFNQGNADMAKIHMRTITPKIPFKEV